jgi:hypothetical protein
MIWMMALSRPVHFLAGAAIASLTFFETPASNPGRLDSSTTTHITMTRGTSPREFLERFPRWIQDISPLVSTPQDADNPSYKAWSQMKVGAWVKVHKVVTKSESGDAVTLSETESTLTLVELTAEKAVIEVSGRLITGTTSRKLEPFKSEIPSRAPPADGSPSPKLLRRDEGEEEVEVSGKKLACRWIEEETEQGGLRTVTRTWRSEQVPGGAVKVESRTEGQQTSSTRVHVRAFHNP